MGSKNINPDGSDDPGLTPRSPPESLNSAQPGATQERELDRPEAISDTQRNGTITAIGVVLGFSLTFLASWVRGDDPWQYRGIPILLTLACGIAMQIISLRRLLILPRSPGLRLSLTDHNKAARLFLWGTALVSAGFLLQVVFEIVHDLGQNG